MSKRFYVTTAIDYLNGQPHLGHAYEKVVVDVIARARRAMGEEVFFLTGLDEHGQKVQQAAQAEGKDPQTYCDDLAASWVEFTRKLALSNDDFVRTTQPRHKEVVQAILSKLHDEGQFYKASYRGFYSASAETFLTEKDRLPDGSFDPSWGKVVELEEENYYFKLSAHQDWIIAHIESNPGFIAPDYRRNEVLGFLKNERLEDLCITRPASRLKWGIPIPFDPGFVTWVWFDALVNYISVPFSLGDPILRSLNPNSNPSPSAPAFSAWPADLHVIGKDILKFHAVYWPIMLKAMGLPLPHQILVHGWWQKDGQKLSKSTGNVVDPVAVLDEWGADAFRYYLVRELAIGPDGNWTDAGFRARYQSELANGLGNLVNRSLSMIKRYRNGLVPAGAHKMARETEETWALVIAAYRANSLQEALQHAVALVTRANQYIDQTSPFKIAKDPARAAELDDILHTLAEVCRVLGILLWPVIPGAAEKLQGQLGFPSVNTNLAQPPPPLPEGHPIGEVFPLFPRKDPPKCPPILFESVVQGSDNGRRMMRERRVKSPGKHLLFAGSGCLLAVGCLLFQRPAAAADDAPARLIAAATNSDFAYQRLARLCDTFGPRLSGSTNLEAAIDWILGQMKSDGLENVHGEEVSVGHWVRGAESAEMLLPRPRRLPMLGLGGSIGTLPEGIAAEVLVVSNFAELTARAQEAAGKIVLFNAPFTSYGETVAYRVRGAVEAARVGAMASLIRSVTPFSIQSPHTGSMSYSNSIPRIPHAAITLEDAEMMRRMQERGEKIVVRLTMNAATLPDALSRNVVAEIAGREKPGEIVLVSGHIDSWDVGQGAMDDGGGAVCAWESVRLLHILGLRPRRTVRVVLWTNEENGTAGARNYERVHKGELSRHVLAIESDRGTFQPEGFSFVGTEAGRRAAQKLAAPLAVIGLDKILDDGGEADVGILEQDGVPTMALVVNGARYFWYHHTEGDTMDKLDPRQLGLCAAAMAVMTYEAAEAPTLLPRGLPEARKRE